MVYSKSILAASSSLKSLNTSSSDSFLSVWFEFVEPFVWFELLFDDELFDDDWPLMDDDKLLAISAVANRWTYSARKIRIKRNWKKKFFFLKTNLWLSFCNLQVCEDIEQQHRHQLVCIEPFDGLHRQPLRSSILMCKDVSRWFSKINDET